MGHEEKAIVDLLAQKKDFKLRVEVSYNDVDGLEYALRTQAIITDDAPDVPRLREKYGDGATIIVVPELGAGVLDATDVAKHIDWSRKAIINGLTEDRAVRFSRKT